MGRFDSEYPRLRFRIEKFFVFSNRVLVGMDLALARIVPSKDRLLVLCFSVSKEDAIISICYLHFSNSFRKLAGLRPLMRYNPTSSDALYFSLTSRRDHARCVMPMRCAACVTVYPLHCLTA